MTTGNKFDDVANGQVELDEHGAQGPLHRAHESDEPQIEIRSKTSIRALSDRNSATELMVHTDHERSDTVRPRSGKADIQAQQRRHGQPQPRA